MIPGTTSLDDGHRRMQDFEQDYVVDAPMARNRAEARPHLGPRGRFFEVTDSPLAKAIRLAGPRPLGHTPPRSHTGLEASLEGS